MKKTDYFKSSDGKSNIYWCAWEPEIKPIAVLQIVHGMSEYIERYEDLALYLNKFGIVVCGDDHIGHGHSTEPECRGHFGEKDGWLHFVEDEERLNAILHERYSGLPIIIHGHSMGSFIARQYITICKGSVDGAILEGTAGPYPAVYPGLFITRWMKLFRGSEYKSSFIAGLAMGSYNKKIPDFKTQNDWLTRDESVVMKYCEDPMCGFMLSLSGYRDLMRLMELVNRPAWFKAYPKKLQTLIAAGTEDPVGQYGKGPSDVFQRLKKSGCSEVKLKLYPNMRHEIHNEIGKEAVYLDIKDFILEVIGIG